jgi:hypothetical protein
MIWVVSCRWLLPPLFAWPSASSGTAQSAAALVINRICRHPRMP